MTDPAAIVVRPPAVSKVLASQTVRLTCVAYGIPLPTITWTANNGGENLSAQATAAGTSNKVRILSKDVTIDGVTVFKVSVLELCGVETNDTKQYRCSADNGVSGSGVASAFAQFFLAVSPGIHNSCKRLWLFVTFKKVRQSVYTCSKVAGVAMN